MHEKKWCPKDHEMRWETLHRMGQGVCVCVCVYIDCGCVCVCVCVH